jgi:putative transposase
MTSYIDEYRTTFGVEPICQVLAVAPSTYYAARSRPASARTVRDEGLKVEITRVHAGNFAVYGVRKVWHQLRREGFDIGRDRVARLMDALGLHGATRTRRVRTTFPAAVAARPADLVERDFTASAPDRLWVADLTYVWTRAGFCYAAFIIDAFSRRIVGWRVCPRHSGPTSPSTPSRWPSGAAVTGTSQASSTTPTGVSSISPSATPSGSPTPGS